MLTVSLEILLSSKVCLNIEFNTIFDKHIINISCKNDFIENSKFLSFT